MNPRQPLWLPPGSVRAILALMLVTATIALAFLGLLDPGTMATLATAAVAFYFGQKVGEK